MVLQDIVSTILTQVESCLNSRPLTPLSCDSDIIEALTPGHFRIGKPIESLPDSSLSYRALPLLRRWHLCHSIVRHFWQRWSTEYVASLRRLTKWRHPARNLQIGDIVVLQDNNLVPTRWPLARVIKAYVGNDKLVRRRAMESTSDRYTRWHCCYPTQNERVNVIGSLVCVTVITHLTVLAGGMYICWCRSHSSRACSLIIQI